MTPKEFYDTVKAMRELQKKYFRTRIKTYMDESKVLEKKIDEEIERVEAKLQPKQGLLF